MNSKKKTGDYLMYHIVTHTDIDGVGSAALYIYLQGEKPEKIYFSEPYLIDRTIKRLVGIRTDKIVFMDLGMNNSFYPLISKSLEKIINRGIEVEWYDHHVWENEWINGMKAIGTKLYIDRSTCATGVVAKYAPRKRVDVEQDFIDELVKGVCAGDLWKFDHWRGPWYLRLVRRREQNSWRLHVIDTLSQGILWKNEFTENIVAKLEKELKAYNDVIRNLYIRNINGLKIVYIPYNDLVDSSFMASLALGRANADIAVIVSRDGKLSFRSTGYNVRELAVKLGGGGHVKASGAKIKIPFKVKMMSLWRIEYLLHYIHTLIEKIIR